MWSGEDRSWLTGKDVSDQSISGYWMILPSKVAAAGLCNQNQTFGEQFTWNVERNNKADGVHCTSEAPPMIHCTHIYQ